MVQSLERALDLLEILAASDDDVALAQLTKRTGLPLGTVHRLLSTLVARGYAAQNPETRLYGPGRGYSEWQHVQQQADVSI